MARLVLWSSDRGLSGLTAAAGAEFVSELDCVTYTCGTEPAVTVAVGNEKYAPVPLLQPPLVSFVTYVSICRFCVSWIKDLVGC